MLFLNWYTYLCQLIPIYEKLNLKATWLLHISIFKIPFLVSPKGEAKDVCSCYSSNELDSCTQKELLSSSSRSAPFPFLVFKAELGSNFIGFEIFVSVDSGDGFLRNLLE